LSEGEKREKLKKKCSEGQKFLSTLWLKGNILMIIAAKMFFLIKTLVV